MFVPKTLRIEDDVKENEILNSTKNDKKSKFNLSTLQCTMVDGTTIARGREVTKDCSCYGSASSCKVKFTTAHIFEGPTKNFSFLACLDKEIMQFS